MKISTVIMALILSFSIKCYSQQYELPRSYSYERPLKYQAFTVLYNLNTNTPYWVAWTYSKAKATRAQPFERKKFIKDPNLGILSPVHDDYTNSGYDRGHMCPAEECSWSEESFYQSFYMSNICPQTPELNRAKGLSRVGSAWRIVEDKCEGPWISKYKTLYIVAGPIPGKYINTIPMSNGGTIHVPSNFFKAIVGETNDGKMTGIGFIFTQNGRAKIVSIDEIERLTKLDLFYSIPSKVQQRIEKISNPNESDWPDLHIIR